MALSPEAWLNLAAGLVLSALCILVLAAKPRHPPVLAFALFALSLAALYLLDVAMRDVPALAASTLSLTIALGALGLMLVFPTPIAGAGRRDAGLVLAYATTYALLRTWVGPSAPGELRPLVAVEIVHSIALTAAMLLFALRARRLPAEETGSARSLAILAIGMFLFTSGSAGRVSSSSPLDAALDGAFAVGPILLWVAATRGHHAALARNVVVAAVIIVLGALYLNSTGATGYVSPIGRVVAALLLGYAVMRGQVDGLDVKVRFAIGKSMIAAVFIAVFFVASEAAQQFFGATFSSAYVGIAAAGMLVFAMAPLQRAAERLAEKAVPVASSADPAAAPASAGAQRRADLYRRAVRFAIRDGRIAPEEEMHLFEVAQELGLGAADAMRLRQEVERERENEKGA